MNGQESSTSADWRKDVHVSAVSTRFVSDTIADTAHLALRFAERILRNGMVDVSPEGGFSVRLHLRDDEVPTFQHAIQLRTDLGETIDERFKAIEALESSDYKDELADFDLALRSKWFVKPTPMHTGRATVFAGNPNDDETDQVIVGIWPSMDDAVSVVTAHNAAMNLVGDDPDLSPVGQAIRTHALHVAYDEGLFAADGTPIVAKGISEASERREREAYRTLMSLRCETIEDVRAKANYILNGTVGDRDPLISIMKGLGGEDPVSPEGYLNDFVRSLLGGSAPIAEGEETMAELRAIGADAAKGLDLGQPQPPEPFETFTTLGEASAPVLLRAALGRMNEMDFAEAANGRTFRLNRLVVRALDSSPTSIKAVAIFVRDREPSATDEEIEAAAARMIGAGAVR